jgi:hypothetical protein
LASIALGVGAVALVLQNGYSLTDAMNEGPSIEVALTFPVVGALIASRHPRNAIGWIFCLAGLSQGLIQVAYLYAEHASTQGRLPAADIAAWLSTWIWIPAVGSLLTFVPLLFPTGQPISRRWRPIAWVSALTIGSLATLVAASTWRLRGKQPLGDIEAISRWFQPLLLLLLGCGLASAASLIFRFRASRGAERQQLKWFAFMAPAVVALVILDGLQLEGASWLIDMLGLLLVPCLPVAVGIAIVRYRLYDIDRIINRTLVYGALTALLAVTYVAIVAAASSLVGSSEITTAGATLAVAALFGPLRRRVQGFIDRRFYRRRYDAAQTLEAFGARVRDEVDLETLTGELLGVVRTTMQPVHASLWLREPVR